MSVWSKDSVLFVIFMLKSNYSGSAYLKVCGLFFLNLKAVSIILCSEGVLVAIVNRNWWSWGGRYVYSLMEEGNSHFFCIIIVYLLYILIKS